MLQLMCAEVLYENLAEMDRGTDELIENDFEVQQLDVDFDDDGMPPTVWTIAWMHTRLSDVEVLNLVTRLVEPFGGFVVQAGLTDEAELAHWLKHGSEPDPPY